MAKKRSANKMTYSQLSSELEKIIDWFEGDEVDLDEAITKYQQAAALITEMEKHLRTAENRIKKITTSFE